VRYLTAIITPRSDWQIAFVVLGLLDLAGAPFDLSTAALGNVFFA